jgi:hypothetical protein
LLLARLGRNPRQVESRYSRTILGDVHDLASFGNTQSSRSAFEDHALVDLPARGVEPAGELRERWLTAISAQRQRNLR